MGSTASRALDVVGSGRTRHCGLGEGMGHRHCRLGNGVGCTSLWARGGRHCCGLRNDIMSLGRGRRWHVRASTVGGNDDAEGLGRTR
jgi:hypothetical protein